MDISIYGLSSISSLLSLLLINGKVNHTFYIDCCDIDPFNLSPLPNPLTNFPSQVLEKQFFDSAIIKKIKKIKKFNFSYYDSKYNKYSEIEGTYIEPIYAIDTRLRLHSFLNRIKESEYVDLRYYNDIPLSEEVSSLNILARGNIIDDYFPINEKFPVDNFQRKRIAFFFNLKAKDCTALNKFIAARIYFINNTGEITIYPFLHKTGVMAINLTVTIDKNKDWDIFDNALTPLQAYLKLCQLIEGKMSELHDFLISCELLDENFRLIEINSVFRQPIINVSSKMFIGVGDMIMRSDPVIGQGYNAGAQVISKIVDVIQKGRDKEFVVNSYIDIVNRICYYLYNVNNVLIQGNGSNHHLNDFYYRAQDSRRLQRILISTFNDISQYFPWLIDENSLLQILNEDGYDI